MQMLSYYSKRILVYSKKNKKNKEALSTFYYKAVVINKYKHNFFVFQVNGLFYYFL